METTDKTRKAVDAAANQAGAAAGDLAKMDPRLPMPAREKTFDELQLPEQIQRLRMEVIILRELTQSQQALIERLMVHQHDARGEMMVPMNLSGIGGGHGHAGRRDGLR